MAENDVLSQDEIDALLGSVDDEGPSRNSGQIDAYDLASQDNVVRTRMPALEMICQRTAKLVRESLFEFLGDETEVSFAGVQFKKYSEYAHSLYVPTCMNMIRARPLKGLGLVVLDAKLVFKLVDNYFGGDGRRGKTEGRDFTPTELRTVQRFLRYVAEDLVQAWKSVITLEIESVGSEVNPAFASVARNTEIVVVSTFHLELPGGGGEMHVTLPYTMIEPIKEILSAPARLDGTEPDDSWSETLRADILDAPVSLECTLAERVMSLRDIKAWKAGDIIPLDFPEHFNLRVNDVPMFKTQMGTSRGYLALRIDECIGAGKRSGDGPAQTTRTPEQVMEETDE